jgi:hypothetical protein
MDNSPLNLVDKQVVVTEYRGQAKNRNARVVEVRDTHAKPLCIGSYRKNVISRSRYLVTIFDMVTGDFRSYYHAYVKLTPVSKTQGWWNRLRNWWVDN